MDPPVIQVCELEFALQTTLERQQQYPIYLFRGFVFLSLYSYLQALNLKGGAACGVDKKTGLLEDLEEMNGSSSMDYQGQVPHRMGHATSAVTIRPPTVPAVPLHLFLETLLQSFSWPPFFVNIQS